MARRGRVGVWVGWGVTGLVSVLFLMSAAMKFAGGEQVEQGMEHLGLPKSLVRPLGVLELACVALYLVPATSVLGAILLTGYLGGVILAHLRVADPVVIPVVLGVFVWLGVALRDGRLWKLIPVRRPDGAIGGTGERPDA